MGQPFLCGRRKGMHVHVYVRSVFKSVYPLWNAHTSENLHVGEIVIILILCCGHGTQWSLLMVHKCHCVSMGVHGNEHNS